MNAYELADELWEKYLDNNECQHGYALSSGCPNDDCKEQALYDAANMLRQQADRIAELEKQTFFIADPEKQGEPIVWMLVDKQTEYVRSIITVKHDFVPEECVEIPLYTSLVFCTAPQTKPLSDEEIRHIQAQCHLKDVGYDNFLMRFARIIEKRHGIK